MILCFTINDSLFDKILTQKVKIETNKCDNHDVDVYSYHHLLV